MRKTIILILAVTVIGCSTVEITKVSDSTYSDGLRFYRPAPYLLVTKDKGDNFQTSIISLPNKNEEYVIRQKVGLGTVDVSATLEGGWNLTQFGTKRDTKVSETIAALTGTIAAAAAFAVKGPSISLGEGLYKIEFDKTTGEISGIKKISLTIK